MKKGYTILIVILVLMAVGIFIITTVNFLGVDEIKVSVAKKDSTLGFYLSTACVEEALMQIKNNNNYTTPIIRGVPQWVTIIIDSAKGYSCSYQVKNKKPPKYIYTRSEISNFPRNLEIGVESVTPTIRIGYWLEK